MKSSITDFIISTVSRWLLKNAPPHRAFMCDFEHITQEIQPADVLLIEGRNTASRIIQNITHSPWTHAALYIGKVADFPELASRYPNWITTQCVIESEVGEGTILSALTKYKEDHIRILRPQGLSPEDARKVITYAISRLGKKYNLRHIFDLLRFLFPWGLFPRKWRSSLFAHNALQPTEDICSSMLADAFHSIDFPILPLVQLNDKNNLELVQRNSRLFTPSDFDYSPYFNVIKYPIFKLGEKMHPQDLPWKRGVWSED